MLHLGSHLHLGIGRLDDQHQAIAELINAIAHRVAQHGRMPQTSMAPSEVACCHQVRELLRQLARITEAHFSEEEQMMARACYPGLGFHRQEHRLLLAELKAFSRGICDGSECMTPTDLAALKGWFIGHLVSDDKPFADYLLEQDVYPLETSLRPALAAQAAY